MTMTITKKEKKEKQETKETLNLGLEADREI